MNQNYFNNRRPNITIPNDFEYKTDMTNIPQSTQSVLNNLKDAINKKRGIFKEYSGLLLLLQELDKSLDTYFTEHDTINEELLSLKERADTLYNELVNAKPDDKSKLELELEQLNNKISSLTADNTLIVKNIEDSVNEAIEYINEMDPKDSVDLREIKLNLKKKLERINPSINMDNIYSVEAKNNERGSLGGYRYDSSSNLRRKSRTRSNSKKSNSSASASSQNNAKKYKKNKNTKKILGGGKRRKMRKTKSKRGSKHGFKCKH